LIRRQQFSWLNEWEELIDARATSFRIIRPNKVRSRDGMLSLD
jgi:hypothetical protein